MRSPLHLGGRGARPQSLADEGALAATSQFSCRVVAEPDRNAVTFHLRGELDSTTANEVRGMLDVAVGEAKVVLDLTEITVIDAAGLLVLQDVIRRVHERAGQVAIARPRRAAKPILDLVGTAGFVYLAFSSAGALDWIDQHSALRRLGYSIDAEIHPIAGAQVNETVIVSAS
jgi:anti-anti-sigma factor